MQQTAKNFEVELSKTNFAHLEEIWYSNKETLNYAKSFFYDLGCFGHTSGIQLIMKKGKLYFQGCCTEHKEILGIEL